MYKFSKDEENVNRYRPEMMLRTGPKVKMKLPFIDNARVLRSPYYNISVIVCGTNLIV